MGYSQIESGAFLQAVDTFKSITDTKVDWHYAMGRAFLYAGEYVEARKHLQTVPTFYWHGAGRILEAACISGLVNAQIPNNANLVTLVKENVEAALAQDRNFWTGLFKGTSQDLSQTYTIPFNMIRRTFPEYFTIE